MSSLSHDKQGKLEQQDWSDQEWEELVKQQLPADLEYKAIELKAWRRQRGVRCISDLLRAWLVLASWGYSFQQLGMWATLKGVATISETAWRKRLRQSGMWIDGLLRTMLKGPKGGTSWKSIEEKKRRIMLIDATRLKTVGGTGDDLRLHWGYDLLSGETQQVEITDHHQAESLKHFQMQKGDIGVLDAGYPVPTTVEEAREQGVDVVLRTTASHLRLETEEGKVINLHEQLKQQPHSQTRRIKARVRTSNGKRQDVQLVAHRLPKEISEAAQERKRKQLQAKRGRHFNQELVWWAGWVLLITTLDEKEWSSAEILRLYRARWQIELIFKRLKQILDRISLEDWARARIVAQLYLIVWLVQEGMQNWIAGHLQSLSQGECLSELGSDDEPTLSSWRMAQLGGEQVQVMLRGTWPTKRILACLDQLRRYLFVHSRQKRPHQETVFRDWLSRKMSALAGEASP